MVVNHTVHDTHARVSKGFKRSPTSEAKRTRWRKQTETSIVDIEIFASATLNRSVLVKRRRSAQKKVNPSYVAYHGNIYKPQQERERAIEATPTVKARL